MAKKSGMILRDRTLKVWWGVAPQFFSGETVAYHRALGMSSGSQRRVQVLGAVAVQYYLGPEPGLLHRMFLTSPQDAGKHFTGRRHWGRHEMT